ncbi:MAG: hypothetical protein K1X89_25965, partial [Myxococcaceae bacterium]|nr:hypothetical protein [Myxococcaceae bacterium]
MTATRLRTIVPLLAAALLFVAGCDDLSGASGSGGGAGTSGGGAASSGGGAATGGSGGSTGSGGG